MTANYRTLHCAWPDTHLTVFLLLRAIRAKGRSFGLNQVNSKGKANFLSRYSRYTGK